MTSAVGGDVLADWMGTSRAFPQDTTYPPIEVIGIFKGSLAAEIAFRISIPDLFPDIVCHIVQFMTIRAVADHCINQYHALYALLIMPYPALASHRRALHSPRIVHPLG
jgi:hypothetical protein